jgi:outer membrane protein OmpA-like peptidoglycan-associated protein
MFKGVVKNCDNAFLNAKIDVKNSKTGEQINVVASNSATGKYMLILPKGETFNIQVDADDYVTQKFQIITVKDEPYKENVIDITLCKENEENDCDDACVTGEKVDKTTFSPSRLEQEKGDENKELFVKNIKEIDYKEGEFKVKKYVVSYDQHSNDVYMVKRDLTTGSVTYKKNYKPITKTTLNLELDRLNDMILEEGESEVKAGNDILITLKNKFEYIKILENDEAVKGDLLLKSVVILEDPQNGTIDYDDETGELEYSPNLGFAGDDKIKYKVCNSNDQCASALVLITVKDPSAVNKAPTLKDDVYEVEQNSIAKFNILGNDKDEDGLLNKRTLQISSDLVNAKASVENNKITYEPYNGFEGESRFNYKVCDNNGACEEASVYVNVKYQSHFNKKDVADEIKELSLFKNSGGNAMDEIDEKISKTSTTDDKGNQTITYYNMYYFFDEYKLRNDAKNAIKGVLKYMNDHPDVNLEIVEHTDNKGAKYYNKILSQKRSDRIKELFVSKGVESQRIKSIGKGESAPIKDCDVQDCNEADFRANKRIEFTYINYKGSFETRDPNQTKAPKEKLKNPKEVEVSQIELMEDMIHFQDILKRRADTYENSIRYRVHVSTYKTELPDAKTKLVDVPGLVVGNDFYGNYIYLSKVYNTPNEANVLARILRRKGFMKSRVVGYVNGKRVSMLDIHKALFR